EENPFLLILGRIGVHSSQDMDLGGNTENLMRLVPCNVLLSSRVFKPPIDMQAEETIEWTAEAKERLLNIPGFVRPMATSAILRYALERGHSMITSSIITEACENILPAGAMQAMNMIGQKLKEKATEGEDPYATADLGSLKDEMMAAHAGEAKDVKLKCTTCGAVMGHDAVKCGVCDAGGERLLPIDHDEFNVEEGKEGEVTTVTTFDSVEVSWTQEAINRLEEFPEGHIRRRAHARIEKNARVQGISTISLAFANKVLNEKTVSGNAGNGGENGSESATPSSINVEDLPWTQEAINRLEKVPPGFMRDNTKSRILEYAGKQAVDQITLQVAEEGIEESKKFMAEAVANGATLEDFLPKK
ncbi:MAG: PCP reductase family protein, partial [Nitrospinales bacterium]